MVFVLENRVVISVHSNTVGEHFFLVVEKGVCAEIIGEIDSLVDGNAAIAGGCIHINGATVSCTSHLFKVRLRNYGGRERDSDWKIVERGKMYMWFFILGHKGVGPLPRQPFVSFNLTPNIYVTRITNIYVIKCIKKKKKKNIKARVLPIK